MLTPEILRAHRLKHSTPVDLEPFIGIKLLVHLGETPVTHQVELMQLIAERGSLNAVKPGDEAGAAVALSRFYDRALPVLTASLLDSQGDVIPAAKAAELFSLVPAGAKGLQLLQQMVGALLERLKPPTPARSVVAEVKGIPAGE